MQPACRQGIQNAGIPYFPSLYLRKTTVCLCVISEPGLIGFVTLGSTEKTRRYTVTDKR
jgi:hypothetical protein